MKIALSKLLSFVKTKKIIILVLLLVIALAMFLLFYLNSDKNNTEQGTEKTYTNRGERLKDNADTNEGKRDYLNYLMSRDQNSEAKKLAEEILLKTNDISDAITLFEFCALNKAELNKIECSKNAVPVLKSKAGDVGFYQAYSVAGMAELIKENELASIFYKQALSKYSEYQPNAEAQLMTKDQISKKIEGLGL